MEKKKRNNATITFSQKEQKEQLLQYLNSVQLQNLMPDGVKGKDCQKVLWAVEYLHRLAVDGKLRVQVPMFEDDSQEKQGLLDQVERLEGILRLYRRIVEGQGLIVDEEGRQYRRRENLIWMKPCL